MPMSRAFVSESDTDAAADSLPELPQSPHPNYVTRRGLRLLEERLAAAQQEHRRLEAQPDDPARDLRLAHVARDIRYLEARLERAIPVDPAQQPTDEVTFGAEVSVRDAQGAHHRFTIVGEDEADAEKGKVSWVSPLARALTGSGVGDVVLWRRPAGEIALEIEAIRYPERKG
jgi:transcription elongation GreA/GreB family factor